MFGRLLAASTILVSTQALAAQSQSAANTGLGAILAATGGAAAQQVQPGTGPLTPEEQRQLLEEVRSLRERVSVLENRAAAAPAPPAPAATAVAGPKFSDTNNLELYGFLQLDAIQDFKRVNPNWDATLRPSRIPTVKGQFGDNGQSIFSVR